LRRLLIPIACAVLLALTLGLYFWAPNVTPRGFFVDEPSITLNAACIAAAGRDEYGVRWPLFFRAFGEYKLPAYIYLQAGLFAIVGPGLLAARLLSMVLGLLAVALLIAWWRRLAPGPSTRGWPFVAVAATFCLLSPWLMVIGRFPVECTMVPLLVAAELALAWKLVTSPRLGWALADGAVVGFSVYVYNGPRILPLAHFGLLGLLTLWRRDWRLLGRLAVAAVAATLVMLPFLFDLFGEQHSLARFNAVRGHGSAAWFARLYFAQLNPVFWFLRGDTNLRHHSGFLGELDLVFLPLLVAGVFECGRRARAGEVFPLYVLLLVPTCFLPSSVSDDGVPHALRTNVALVPLWTVAFYGYLLAAGWVRAGARRWRQAVAALLLALGVVEAVAGAVYYQTVYPTRADRVWIGNGGIAATRRNPRDVPTTSHSGGTVFDRFYRVVDRHELRYCGL
jgi:hypothetical protein